MPPGVEPVSLDPPAGSSFVAFDLVDVADGPTISPGLWSLFYPRAVNGVSGEPGLGKSWLGVAAALTMLRRGGSVIVVDFEDVARTWATRLRSLGAEAATLADLVYLRGAGPPSEPDLQWLPRLAGVAPDMLVVIDSMAEAMAASGLDENLAGDVTSWHQGFARPLADAGATVLVIDHVPKDASSRGRWARGSGAKLAAITGAAFTFDVSEPFSRERSGRGTLTVAKDRHGAVGPVGAAVVEVRFVVGGGSLARVEVVDTTPRPHGESLPSSEALALHRNNEAPR
jgi:hypothetical protein